MVIEVDRPDLRPAVFLLLLVLPPQIAILWRPLLRELLLWWILVLRKLLLELRLHASAADGMPAPVHVLVVLIPLASLRRVQLGRTVLAAPSPWPQVVRRDDAPHGEAMGHRRDESSGYDGVDDERFHGVSVRR